MKEMPLVSIGMPVYNRPESLRKALTSIVNQTYTNLEIIISDNCSPNPEVAQVIKKFQTDDKRIALYQQKENIGAAANFRFVERKASADYFMWASNDDFWLENFVQTGLEFLLKHTQYQMWFCTIENIDSYDRVSRRYAGFSRFTSTENKKSDIIKFLFEPEILGKANLIYGIYTRKSLQNTISKYFINERWGSDMCFNLAFISRYNIFLSDEVLLQKRIANKTDSKDKVNPIVIKNPSLGIFPSSQAIKYIMENFNAVKTTKYKYLVVLIMSIRVLVKIFIMPFQRIFFKISKHFSK